MGGQHLKTRNTQELYTDVQFPVPSALPKQKINVSFTKNNRHLL
jgi:hypothetical protein